MEVGVIDERDAGGQLHLSPGGHLLWDAGLAATPPRKVVVKTAMRMVPARAVPIDVPRFVTVFWIPPTSPLRDSGTDDTVTAPSCEARLPMPSPASSMGHVVTSVSAPSSSANEQRHDAEEQEHEADSDDPPWRGVGEHLRHADGGNEKGEGEGQEPDPSGHGGQAEGDRQEQGYREEETRLQQEFQEEGGQSRLELRRGEHARIEQGTLAP